MEHEQLSDITLDSQGLILREFGNKLYRQGRYEAAIKYYQRFLVFQRGDIALYGNLSKCLKNLNRIEEAIASLEKGIGHYPTAGKLHFEIVIIYQQNGRTRLAILSAEIATEILLNEYVFKLFKHLTLPIVYSTLDEIIFYRERFIRELQNLIKQTSLRTPEDQINALRGFSSFTNFT